MTKGAIFLDRDGVLIENRPDYVKAWEEVEIFPHTFDAMRKLRLRDPLIQEGQSSVTVVIPHQRLASPEDLVMEFLRKNPEITNRQARELCGVKSENSMKGIFKRLEARGSIEQVPDRTRFKAAWRQKDG